MEKKSSASLRSERPRTASIHAAILIILLANLACGGGSIPTSPPPSAGGQATGQARSSSNGEARFEDPISGKTLTITLEDQDTSQPVANADLNFVSDGTSVLVIVQDPSGEYAPTVGELRYSELSFQGGGAGKNAFPGQISLGAVILLVKLINLYEDFQDWRAFITNFPRIETWSREQVSLCVTPEQGRQALGLGADQLIGFVSGKVVGEKEIEQALRLIFDELAEEGTGDILDAHFGSQQPAILRFTVFDIKDGFPKFLRIDGFCLSPYEASDPRSALEWLLYGIHQEDLYPFRILTSDQHFFYANYLEGGDPVGRAQFLQDLQERFASSTVSCTGYFGDPYAIQVWTTGWSPPWEMHQLCYVGCETLNPPYQNSTAGFFLGKENGRWILPVVYINDPENYYFGSYELTSCEHPEQLDLQPAIVSPNGTSSESCPGAPPQRLTEGGEGVVCTQSDNVRLRNGPSRGSDIILNMPPGTPFTVLSGPRCADDWSWWEVQTTDGITGWVAEGGDSVDPYFVCPLQ